eukprot:scaffold22747_cov129-Amphora_coffeaeformis.AAC.1
MTLGALSRLSPHAGRSRLQTLYGNEINGSLDPRHNQDARLPNFAYLKQQLKISKKTIRPAVVEILKIKGSNGDPLEVHFHLKEWAINTVF